MPWLDRVAFPMALDPLDSKWTVPEQLENGIRGFVVDVSLDNGRPVICAGQASQRNIL